METDLILEEYIKDDKFILDDKEPSELASDIFDSLQE